MRKRTPIWTSHWRAVHLIAFATDSLLPQPQALHDLQIALLVLAIEIGQMSSALSHQLQQSTPRVLICLVDLEMLDQLVDTGGQQRDLDLGRPCIIGMQGVVLNDGILLALG